MQYNAISVSAEKVSAPIPIPIPIVSADTFDRYRIARAFLTLNILAICRVYSKSYNMAIWVVEFSNGGYKIRKIFS